MSRLYVNTTPNPQNSTSIWDSLAGYPDTVKYVLWPMIQDKDFVQISRANTRSLYNQGNAYNVKRRLKHEDVEYIQELKIQKENVIRRNFIANFQNNPRNLSNAPAQRVLDILSKYTGDPEFTPGNVSINEKELRKILESAHLPRHKLLTDRATNITILSDISESDQKKLITYKFFPPGLTHLTMDFNSPLIKNFLPDTLRHLKLENFNQPILHGVLPDTLLSLALGSDFNKSLEGVLPESLRFLDLGGNYNYPIKSGVIPYGLQHLIFSIEYNHPIIKGSLPSSINEIGFNLDYGECYFDQTLSRGELPSSLKILTLSGYNRDLNEGSFPHSLRKLLFTGNFDKTIKAGILHEGLLELDLGDNYDFSIERGVLPSSLRILKIGRDFSQPLEPWVLPRRLMELDIESYSLPVNVDDLIVFPRSLVIFRSSQHKYSQEKLKIKNRSKLSEQELAAIDAKIIRFICEGDI